MAAPRPPNSSRRDCGSMHTDCGSVPPRPLQPPEELRRAKVGPFIHVWFLPERSVAPALAQPAHDEKHHAADFGPDEGQRSGPFVLHAVARVNVVLE